MKVKKYVTQSIAMLMCVVVLSLSIGGNFCFYNNIAKAHAADPFTITMGSLALEEIIMGIAIAVLGADVAYQYRDEILDAYKEFSKNGNNLYAGQNLFEVYSNGEHSVRTWDEYEEILKGMGSTASEVFDDYKEKFNNVYVKPSKEYLQYVADFYTNIFNNAKSDDGIIDVTGTGYITGLSEYLSQKYFTSYQINSAGNYIYSGDFISYVSTYTSNGEKRHRDVIVNYGSCNYKYPMVAYKASDGVNGFSIGCLGVSGKSVVYPIYANTISNGSYVEHDYGPSENLNSTESGSVSNDMGYLYGWSSSFTKGTTFWGITSCPLFNNKTDAQNAIKTGDFSKALNFKISLDSIAVTGDDIPTVGNWEELWERLKNPDLPWWFLNPDALPGTNAVDLPWFDVAGLHDWANDIPDIKDGIIDTAPDIPWTDVWDKVIDIPDVIIPEIDFPYPGVQDPSIPKVDDPTKPGVYDPSTDKPIDLTDEMEGIADYVPTLADSFTDLGNGLKTKFPFSIPWDIHYILSGLASAPKAPRFELPLKVERYGIDETIVVDMARFQVLSDLSRSIFSLLFAMVLINLTIKVIGSLKEE